MISVSLPKIATAAQMRSIDNRAINTMGVPGLTLMENAGSGIAQRVRDTVFDGSVEGKRVAIVCGRGNNGGDGFVVGRYLAAWGATVAFYLVGSADKLTGDAKANYERAIIEAHLPLTEIVENTLRPDFQGFDLLVDAVFGTGFKGPVRGVAEVVIEAMNASGVPIVAVDSPSGLDSDSGAVSGSIVTATYTISLAVSKRGQWMWPGRTYRGRLEVCPIGIPDAAVEAEGIALSLITREYAREALPDRPPDGHKGSFGKALIIGGSVGMSGALVLAVNACMRSGAGLTYAGCPASLADGIDAGAIEAVVLALPEVTRKRALARRGLGEILRHFDHVDAVAVGPGLSRHHETQELVRRLVTRRSRPMVLDADGLNAVAGDPSVMQDPQAPPLIITPHVGEMARLLALPVAEVAADREAAAVEAASRFGVIAVMKGAPTFVADPSGQVCLNPTGNSGMASGGVGDALTGMIVSFLAQGCEPLTAALLGVYVHGLAGDFAAAETGERSLVASDLVMALPEALQYLEE